MACWHSKISVNAAGLVFNQPKTTHVIPLLHWLPLSACIKFRSLMCTYGVASGAKTHPSTFTMIWKWMMAGSSINRSHEISIHTHLLCNSSVTEWFTELHLVSRIPFCLQNLLEDHSPLRVLTHLIYSSSQSTLVICKAISVYYFIHLQALWHLWKVEHGAEC